MRLWQLWLIVVGRRGCMMGDKDKSDNLFPGFDDSSAFLPFYCSVKIKKFLKIEKFLTFFEFENIQIFEI